MKFADPKPPFCAACFQHSTGPHVDFEAYYDGPVIEKDGIKVPVDDLILCESCVRSAAKMFGMLDPEMLTEQIEEAQAENEELRKENSAKDDVISDLTYTVGILRDFPTKARVGRPKLAGLPDDVKKELNTRIKQSQTQKGRPRAVKK